MKKESGIVRFLYNTVVGRLWLKLLTAPMFSQVVSYFLASSASRVLISYYIRKHNIPMHCYSVPMGGYRSFNDFFTRKKKPLYEITADAKLVSPCDGLLTVKYLDENAILKIKNSRYHVWDLVLDIGLATRYANGTALIFRLTPAHYHRYCYCADGKIIRNERIEGILHCVRPIALKNEKVFSQNTREYEVLLNDDLGQIVQMEVGAMLVGKIENESQKSGKDRIVAGEEKGYFAFGGSTIILLIEDRIRIHPDLLLRAENGEEVPVMKGEALL